MAAKVFIGLTKSLEKKGYVVYTDNFIQALSLQIFCIHDKPTCVVLFVQSKRLPKGTYSNSSAR